MRALATLCVLCALGGGITAIVVTSPAGAAEQAPARARITPDAGLIAKIDHYRRLTWRWQTTMGVPRTQSARTARASTDPAYRRWVLRLWTRRSSHVQRRAARWLVAKTNEYRREVEHWQRVMGVRSQPVRRLQSASAGTLRNRKREMLEWRRKAARTSRRAAHPPRLPSWLCIHRFEGSWTDRGGPYYGGLQMDLSFQRHYGGYLLRTKGTADRWTPTEQIWVAEKAYRSGRGFHPWPHTARVCGLI